MPSFTFLSTSPVPTYTFLRLVLGTRQKHELWSQNMGSNSKSALYIVTLGKLLNLSVPWFPPLQNGDFNSTYLVGILWGLRNWIHLRFLAHSSIIHILAIIKVFKTQLTLFHETFLDSSNPQWSSLFCVSETFTVNHKTLNIKQGVSIVALLTI